MDDAKFILQNIFLYKIIGNIMKIVINKKF